MYSVYIQSQSVRIRCLFLSVLARYYVVLRLSCNRALSGSVSWCAILETNDREGRMPRARETHYSERSCRSRAFRARSRNAVAARQVRAVCHFEMDLAAKNDRSSANAGDERAINSPAISPESSFLSLYSTTCTPRNSHAEHAVCEDQLLRVPCERITKLFSSWPIRVRFDNPDPKYLFQILLNWKERFCSSI